MTLTLAILAMGCTEPEQAPPHVPRFSDINFAVDGYIDTLDRIETLDDALEESLNGEPIDLATASDIFLLAMSSGEIQALDDPLDPTEDDYSNIVAGTSAALSIDLTQQTRMGSMAQTLGAMQTAAINDYTEWHWSGSQSVTNDEGVTVTAEFNQHWVGTGWLVEVLQSSQDGEYDQTLWFNGYYQADGGLGWWDIYRSGGVLVTMEWLGGRGDGEVEMYWASGEDQGDRMWYAWGADGSLLAEWSDTQPAPNEPVVTLADVDSDKSGQAIVPSYNDSDTVCWDSALENTDCPTSGTTTK